jgi:hypothetical protein
MDLMLPYLLVGSKLKDGERQNEVESRRLTALCCKRWKVMPFASRGKGQQTISIIEIRLIQIQQKRWAGTRTAPTDSKSGATHRYAPYKNHQGFGIGRARTLSVSGKSAYPKGKSDFLLVGGARRERSAYFQRRKAPFAFSEKRPTGSVFRFMKRDLCVRP